MENSSLYLTIREERIRQGLSQKELGEMVGLPQQAINRIEQGQRKLDVELFEKLCKSLNIKKIGSFTVNFISSYYKMDVGDDPICPVDELQDEFPSDDSDKIYDDPLSYEHSYSYANSEEEYDKYLEQCQKQGEEFLLTDYRKLNATGKAEARKRVNELTEIPRYTISPEPPEE